MLGHDLRTPLDAILHSAELMLASGTLSASHAKAASNIVSSSLHIQQMLLDLLDITSTRLGGSLAITPRPTDLGSTCQQVIAEVQAAYHERTVIVRLTGDLTGSWDAGRLVQMSSNLVQNVLQHGAKDRPVTVSAIGENGLWCSRFTMRVRLCQSASQRIFESRWSGRRTSQTASGNPLDWAFVCTSCDLLFTHMADRSMSSRHRHKARLPK